MGNEDGRIAKGRRIPGLLETGPAFLPRNDRERRRIILDHLVLHFRPIRATARTLRFTHTWGLGGMAALLFGVLVATGTLMMFVYEPSPGLAWESVASIRRDVFFGRLVRNVHHWSAHLLILIVFLHFLRVFFTGAWHGKRRFNWVIGLGLFAGVLAANFTGYLLPWDQLSYWAITIVTSMLEYVPWIGEGLRNLVRGGPEIGPRTLILFYTLHTAVIPVLLALLMAWHFWRVRKAGGVVVPRAPGESVPEDLQRVLSWPHLLVREFVVALVLLAGIGIVSVFFDAGLGDAANPGMSPNPAKAPWYFLGAQELLLHFHPFAAVMVLPGLAAAALLLLPYFRYETDAAGVFLVSRKGRRMAAAAAAAALVITPAWVVVGEFAHLPSGWTVGLPPALLEGWIPVLILGALLLGGYRGMKRGFGATKEETVVAMFVFLVTAFVILTAVGIWFRGPGMALVWPWDR